MEVKRSKVEVWRVRAGPGEQAEAGWRERHQPTEVMTHTSYKTIEAAAQSPGRRCDTIRRKITSILIYVSNFTHMSPP